MVKIESDPKLDFHNVLIRPKRSTLNSRSEVNLERKITFRNNYEWTGIPIVSANMSTTGTFEVYNVLKTHKIITAFHKFYTLSDYKKFEDTHGKLDPDYFMISTGMSIENFKNLCEILDNIECKWICIDIANGYISNFVEYCRKVRNQFPNHVIVAGNVATREIVEELIINGGVDIVKVGIGPGSACTTRKKTGVGMPQLSAILECADAAHGLGGHIISDGGITCPGDMAKAFCGGADFVMCGGILAGHDENPGEIITEIVDGKETKFKKFYGMSSSYAMNTHYGKMEKYRSSEGRELKILYKGSIENTILDYLGGLRSTCTYINSLCIKNMPKCTTFILVSQQLNTVFVNK